MTAPAALLAVVGRVRSGAQEGADLGAVKCALARGVPTGGWMPKGFRSRRAPGRGDAYHPEYAELYGVREHPSREYRPRTRLNVGESDVTVRVAFDFTSPGELCTARAVLDYGKPHEDVGLRFWVPERAAEWFQVCGGRLGVRDEAVVRVAARLLALRRELGRPLDVNVAGNSEWAAPGIEAATALVLGKVLDLVGDVGPLGEP